MPYTPPSRSTSKNPSNSNTTINSQNNNDAVSNNNINNNNNNLRSIASANSLKKSAFHKFMNNQNDSFYNQPSNSNASRSKFYLLDNNTSDSNESLELSQPMSFPMKNMYQIKDNLSGPPPIINISDPSSISINTNINNENSSGLNSSINLNNNYNNNANKNNNNSSLDMVNKFTTESTQSYSYTPISNNSLSMRMNVLKRSLEILLENPNWLTTSLESFPDYNTHINYIDSNNSQFNQLTSDRSRLKDLIKSDRSVSYSTLQALLQRTISTEKSNDNDNNSNNNSNNNNNNNTVNGDANIENSTNSNKINDNLNQVISNRSDSISSISSNSTSINSNLNESILNDLHEMLKLLDGFQKQNIEISSEDLEDKVLNLHTLSLANASTENALSNSLTNILPKSRRELLKIKLLHALATPFIEQQNSTQTVAGIPLMKTTSSTFGLSSLNSDPSSSSSSSNISAPSRKVFHASSNAKTNSPKAVFTVSTESPWDLLNANDLGLLMFGLSRSSLRKMKLMDLIAPRSRNLVINRLNRDKPLVFSGEIIAVKRNNKSLAWTSLWAKRRENLIILIFEQVVCETIDMIVERDNILNSEFYVKEIIKQNKSLYKDYLQNYKLSEFLPSMSSTLKNTEISSFNDDDITSIQDSNIINHIRYFTLKRDNDFVPCAIASEYLNIDDDDKITKSLIRINLHSLPYIAGSFVISAKDYLIQSFNEAIAKNLFGRSDLIYQSIDVILPNFKNLLKLALIENPNMNLQKGLVLPEHYFRKLDSWSKGSNDKERELLFLKCNGIQACHNDGNLITVDVQLHISENNLYVIWITFCRTFSKTVHKINKDNDQIDNNKDDGYFTNNDSLTIKSNSEVYLNKDKKIDENQDLYHLNDDTTDSNGVPSQMKLFDSHYNNNNTSHDNDSQSSTNSNLSRTHSLKTINQQVNPSSPGTPTINKSHSLTKINNTEFSEPVDIDKTKIFGMSKQLTCKEHLINEENELKYLRENSSYFPKVIGAEKRSKKFGDFKILKNLGQGAYGKVVFAQYKKDPLYKDCVKAIFKERILVDTWVRDRELGTVPSEIQILYALNKYPHANIMRIIDFFEDENCYYLETLQHGSQGSGAVDLYDIIEIKKDMTEYEAKYIYFQITAALTHMHEKGIVHRDIKDENVIVDKEYFVKLIDFGSAAWVKDGPFGVFVGTIDYAAPEVLNGQPYEGKAQDVWAMGVLLYTLVFKENPFCSVDEILDGEIKFPQYGDVSNECMELIKKILVTDVNKRPTMQEIKDDPWLQGFS